MRMKMNTKVKMECKLNNFKDNTTILYKLKLKLKMKMIILSIIHLIAVLITLTSFMKILH